MVFAFITNKLGGYYAMRQRFEKTNSPLSKKLYSFINRKFQEETNSYLPYNNTIKGPINFLHGTSGIFISGDAIIGKNCTIFQQVTIGSNMLIDSKGFGSPTIGDNCLIGAGAKIIGNITIGNNCRIGANAVVTHDVAANTVVVPNKPMIIHKENLNNNTYQFSNKGWGYVKDGAFVIETDKVILKKLTQLHSNK